MVAVQAILIMDHNICNIILIVTQCMVRFRRHKMTGKEYVSAYRISEWHICLFVVCPRKVWYPRTMVPPPPRVQQMLRPSVRTVILGDLMN